MRHAYWIPILISLLVAVIILVWPGILAALMMTQVEHVSAAANNNLTQSAILKLILRTAAWSAAISLGAVIIGWFPGRWLASIQSKRVVLPLLLTCILPLCLPPYVLFWAWWQSCSPGTATFEFLLKNDLVQYARYVTLWLGLVSWAWPIAAIIVAGSTSIKGRDVEELLALDDVSLITRAQVILRTHAKSLSIAFMIIFLVVFNNTDCFDLAQVRTIGYELRALDSEGASPALLIRTSLPGIAMAIVLASLLLILGRANAAPTTRRPSRARKIDVLFSCLIFAATILLPCIALLSQPNWIEGTGDVISGYADATWNTALAAAVAAAVASILSIGLAMGFAEHRRWIRVFTMLFALGWIVSGMMPAMVNAVAIEAVYNNAMFEWIYHNWPIVVIGYLSRFGFVAAIAAVWIQRLETDALRDLRYLDNISTLRELWTVHRPRWLAGGIAVFVIVFILSFSEVIVTSRLRPPGFETIASILLNNMHYQRNEMVVLMSLLLFGLAALAASIVAMTWLTVRQSATSQSEL